MNADTIHPAHRIQIENDQELEAAFHDYHLGSYLAFHFFHVTPAPWLAVLINGSKACLHYFPAGDHPGFQSVAVPSLATTSAGTIHFLQSGGSEADAFDLPASMVVSAELALAAAREFLHAPTLPTCIKWQEL